MWSRESALVIVAPIAEGQLGRRDLRAALFEAANSVT